MRQEQGKWRAYNVRAISRNVELVFKTQDMHKLNNPTYQFITLHMGFIAHFNLQGFQSTYGDLRDFARTLQTSEYSSDVEYNLSGATRQETDGSFNKWYGSAYNKSIAEATRNIVGIARKYQPAIETSFSAKQREAELGQAAHLAAKHGHMLIPSS